jgi:hypothetical protein
MKKTELKQIIKEELLKEFKGGVLDYFYNQGYSAGQMLNPLVDELIKTKGLEGAKNHIGSLVGDEPQYDMSSRTPFREGALKEYERGHLTQGMDLQQPLEDLKAAFEKWKNSSYTKEKEIEPAKKELLAFVTDFIINTI